jgi:hypothetical protein
MREYDRFPFREALPTILKPDLEKTLYVKTEISATIEIAVRFLS